MNDGWEPACFLAWYRVSQKKKWLVQVIARKVCFWGEDFYGFRSDTGESYLFTGSFLEKIS
jgi:regulation of enolase protein 1 (concanavalin A-like superfamily)